MHLLNRRSLITTVASAVPAAALAATPALAAATDPDAELIELGRQAEALVAEYFEANFGWAPRLCEAHRTVNTKFGHLQDPFGAGVGDPQSRVAWAVFNSVLNANGCESFSARQEAAFDALWEIRERVADMDATTPAGLRVKLLLAIWESSPHSANSMDAFRWDDPDTGTRYELVRSVANVVGLLPLVEGYEKRFAELAAEIKAAGGDGWPERRGTQRNEFMRRRTRQQVQRRKAERRASIQKSQRPRVAA